MRYRIKMPLEEKAIEIQERIERKVGGIGKGKYARILKMAKKPNEQEYKKVLLITGAGIVFLGFVGFLIYYLMGFVFHVP
jgi:protein transport protein SEC61 subunit gamma-like protein